MSYLTLPFVPVFSTLGAIAPGAKLYFYATGTSNPATVYADADLTTPLSNPVIANSAGRFVDIFTDDTITYRIRLETSTGTLIDEADPARAAQVNPLDVLEESDAVAINRSTALSPLHVGGDIRTDGVFLLPNSVTITQGAGSPEGVVSASPRSLYLTGGSLFVKMTGTGNTGWWDIFRMLAEMTGDIGIGTLAPQATLDVDGTIRAGQYFVLPSGAVIAEGVASPEGAFAAPPASLYLTPAATYRKSSGTGNTGWVAI